MVAVPALLREGETRAKDNKNALNFSQWEGIF
jgi:hypothetical protein